MQREGFFAWCYSVGNVTKNSCSSLHLPDNDIMRSFFLLSLSQSSSFSHVFTRHFMMDNRYPWTQNPCIQSLPIDTAFYHEPSANPNDNSTIEFSHEHPQHPYMIMTRAASPVVFGQTNRRPLTMGNPAVLGKLDLSCSSSSVL